ncbi:glycan metabolism protein RagB [Flavobacterium sp. Root935]|uniref:RagB/SusD family nutrient uptake outer membrane protein n=1 Tax=unclassified Flavobacterium TaxID=196869 RepID=UPI00070C5054|nr:MULTISPECIES: RagB/SusD family nutrient uptake outer membrane protein [unclassified Flavobacterium]KRD57827.1 glycan metabolism protein RagB [Flavobacterium sp. Root935]TDX10460.1 putative outer membrane starch-binding protein [Flavobacterium sp. S87F.05.LMB.W.Kidney.N]
MKKILYIAGFAVMGFLASCSDFLENDPRGVLSEEDIVTPQSVEGFMNAAYAQLGNDHYDSPYSLWPFGNVRSDDAYKGGSGTNDIQDFHFFEVSNNIRPDFGELDSFWYISYVGVSRANKALKALEQLSEADYPLKKTRMAEMRFLRGHFYFMLKIMFRDVPYITEDIPVEDYKTISNKALSNEELWNKIAEDFQAAADNLPETQPQVGRATKKAAYAYLAKTRLYQAYTQDETFKVTGINQQHLQEVIAATDNVIGKASLEPDFANNFLPGTYENGPESIFSIQFSDNDGTLYGRLNFSDVLSTPQGLGCCDFHKPSQNLVNAFKTGVNGLPEFDTYNDQDFDYKNIDANTVDPRLYHTVAMPGLPYKYDPEFLYVEAWVRSPGTYGYFASLKENVAPSCSCVVNIDPFYGNSKNRIQIRYADVVLMRAEALIELGRQSEALPLINEIRERAAQSTGRLPYVNNFKINTYVDGSNCNWTQDFARKALRWERRLELAMEGSRFFDLVRWGITDQVMNDFYAKEKTKRTYYQDAFFDAHKEEYCPIPLKQINFSQGLYKQNPGY